jgi:hypothetical protein
LGRATHLPKQEHLGLLAIRKLSESALQEVDDSQGPTIKLNMLTGNFALGRIDVDNISNEVGSVKNVFVLVFGFPVHTRWVCPAALG